MPRSRWFSKSLCRYKQHHCSVTETKMLNEKQEFQVTQGMLHSVKISLELIKSLIWGGHRAIYYCIISLNWKVPFDMFRLRLLIKIMNNNGPKTNPTRWEERLVLRRQSLILIPDGLQTSESWNIARVRSMFALFPLDNCNDVSPLMCSVCCRVQGGVDWMTAST